MLQTQGKKMQNRSSSVDTRSSSVDTRDSFQETFWPIWDSVSTLDQVAADTTGKKNSLVWGSPAPPAAKNSSTRPQQDVNSSPRNFPMCLSIYVNDTMAILRKQASKIAQA
ncbi:hypothetical protein Taro_000301 [Colocasia esculenta]|uniref:Uncharacterized protein n=1 Tax=Colocasia esculenta TaxID=4460 RepID=A0A843TAH9_COLES|nr:hypothetical protein [Colocasia esculenta]